jgi:hypothetical protein
MAKRKLSLWPVMMLAIGIAAGWWVVRYGLPLLGQFELSTTKQASGDIHQVDFRNFTYPALCAAESGLPAGIPVRNGEFTQESEDSRFSFGILSVSYGDITGVGQPEAAVAASCNTGGTGQFSEGMVFSMRGNAPELLGRVEGGDRAFGGLAGLGIENGLLVVEHYATDDDGPACCPKYIDTTRMRWTGGRLVQDGARVRRNAPAE